jgi:hypothetical protein
MSAPQATQFDELAGEGRYRPAILFVVLAVHLGVLALLLKLSLTLGVANSPNRPLELVFLAPVTVPPALISHSRPQRLSSNVAMALASPVLNSSFQFGPSAAPDGNGSAVNWTAEAHRAVRAFEIRRDQPSNSALSVSSSLDERGSREHHADDQLRTDSGDWIVWINGDCYQVASWHSGETAFGASSPPTFCRNSNSAQRANE